MAHQGRLLSEAIPTRARRLLYHALIPDHHTIATALTDEPLRLPRPKDLTWRASHLLLTIILTQRLTVQAALALIQYTLQALKSQAFLPRQAPYMATAAAIGEAPLCHPIWSQS